MTNFVVKDLKFLTWGPFDFNMHDSDCLCITGPSGSGKSLLLRSLADLDPHQGEIYLDNIEHMSIPAPLWRTKVGLLPAKSWWWHETVGEHLPRVDTTVLQRLGFDADVVGWSVDRLSTGEQQRLALVRLLANQPSVLLLDEPTASLDPENTRTIENLIKEYSLEHLAPIVWVSHDPAQAKRVSDQRYEFSHSRLRPQEESA